MDECEKEFSRKKARMNERGLECNGEEGETKISRSSRL